MKENNEASGNDMNIAWKKVIVCISGWAVLLALSGCPSPVSQGKRLLSTGEITEFSFKAEKNSGLGTDVTGTIDGANIYLVVPYAVLLKQLKLTATFRSNGMGVYVNDEQQTSGATRNLFDKPLRYRVIDGNGQATTYNVLVVREPFEFGFRRNDNVGILSSDVQGAVVGHDITVHLLKGTSVDGLKPYFSDGVTVRIGDRVQVSGETAQDFTLVQTYTVSTTGKKEDFTVNIERVEDYHVGVRTDRVEVSEGSGFRTPEAIGDSAVINIFRGDIGITMIYANDDKPKNHPTHALLKSINRESRNQLQSEFWLGESEVTNAVVAAIYQWAHDNYKFSTTVSDHNGVDSTVVKYGGRTLQFLAETLLVESEYTHRDPLEHNTLTVSRFGASFRTDFRGEIKVIVRYGGGKLHRRLAKSRITYDADTGTFSVESGYEDYPVTRLTLYGAVMLCNWLTEMRDSVTDNVVYTNIPENKNWDIQHTREDTRKSGYRLPRWDEWEYAARYRGDDPVNTVSGYADPYFTKWNSYSEATATYLAGMAGPVTVYTEEAMTPKILARIREKRKLTGGYLGTFVAWTDGDSHKVKALRPNALGIYDMSGNVWEWSFSRAPAWLRPQKYQHMAMGGSTVSGGNFIIAGATGYLGFSAEGRTVGSLGFYADGGLGYTGFRLCRSGN